MKRMITVMILILIVGLGAVFFILNRNDITTGVDIVDTNDIVMNALPSGADDTAANQIIAQLTLAMDDVNKARSARDTETTVLLYAVMGLFSSAFVLLLLNVNKSILKPFRKMKRFAKNVASGNLDVPLKMDKKGSFGAFTESFDLMRAELLRAREAERKADQSKKELVASLSHDIKTPLASIKAVSDLMLVTAQDDRQRTQIAAISAKADQIGLLVHNIFSATLEELQKLKVLPCVIQSDTLDKLIKDADYDQKVTLCSIPECLILADPMRLAQVLDNIISNSYKYSGTPIEINAEIKFGMMHIDIIDFGGGVLQRELPLLTQKYYRGQNAKDKSGTGLGLFLSKYFMEQMSGEIACENRTDGFAVRLALKLA